MRLCCRCGKTYRVNKHGEYITKEDCIYHWGRIRPQRGNLPLFSQSCFERNDVPHRRSKFDNVILTRCWIHVFHDDS